jgi:hypothetical protein
MGSSVLHMSNATPWEPPLAGTEEQALLGALDRMRWTFRYKIDDLDAAGLRSTVGASTLTLSGLAKHLAAQEDYMSAVKMAGDELGEPWSGWGWDGSNDWEFTSAADDPPEAVYRTYDDAVERTRARVAAYVAEGGLDRPVAAADGRANLRRLLHDHLEEYARHLGQADLIREAVDGRVGEDPPDGWRPVGGANHG